MAKDAVGSDSKIRPILGHLAWLKTQSNAEINRDRAYDAALLIWNAAVVLQWYFVMPVSPADQIAEETARNQAAKLIDDFVWAMKAVFEGAEALKERDAERIANADDCRQELHKRLAVLLKRLPVLFKLESPKPVRLPELEHAQDYAKLLRDWATNHPRTTAVDLGLVFRDVSHGPADGLRRSLAGLLVANDPRAMGMCSPQNRKLFRKTLAGFVEFDCEEATDRSRGIAGKRWLELGESIAARLRAAGGRN
jgi:hypothetical protein